MKTSIGTLYGAGLIAGGAVMGVVVSLGRVLGKSIAAINIGEQWGWGIRPPLWRLAALRCLSAAPASNGAQNHPNTDAASPLPLTHICRHYTIFDAMGWTEHS